MTSKYSVVTTPAFEREYNELKGRFPNIDDDYEEFLDEVEIYGSLGDPCQGL